VIIHQISKKEKKILVSKLVHHIYVHYLKLYVPCQVQGFLSSAMGMVSNIITLSFIEFFP